REVAARSGETGDQAVRDRVGADREDNRYRRGGALGRVCGRRPEGCDHIDFAVNEVSGQGGQPIIVPLRPAVLDRYILSLDIAGFTEALAEYGGGRGKAGRRQGEGAGHPPPPTPRPPGGAPAHNCPGGGGPPP